MKSWVAFSIFLLLSVVLEATQPAQPPDAHHDASQAEHALINTCLITNNLKELTEFYTRILQIEPLKTGDNYVEFRTNVGTLALFAVSAQEKYIPNSATAAQNHSAILEFRVANPDQEYARLRPLVKSWVKGPTTQPWGTRSIYFRDPDGNLVDFFTPAAK